MAVPDGATNVTVTYAEPHWDSCDGREGTHGWSSIGVYISFRTGMTPDPLLVYASARIKTAGWSESMTLSSPLGPGQQWTRTLSNGTIAGASLTPGTDGATTRWELAATAAPYGQQVSGC